MNNNGNKYRINPIEWDNRSMYKQVLENSLDPIKKLAKGSPVITESMKKINSDITKTLREVIEKYNENWDLMLRGIRDKEVVIEAFLKYDIPPHHKFKISLLTFIIYSYSEGKPQEVVEDIVKNRFYSYIYPELMREWRQNQAAKSRINLLILSLKGFEEGYYGLVVPTIIAQIEGVLLEKINEHDFNTKQLRAIIRSIFDGVGVVNTDKTLSKFYCDKIVGNREPSSVQRHGVLHGSLYNYHTEIDAIKAILIFDTIVSRVNDADSKYIKSIYIKNQNERQRKKKAKKKE